LSELNSTWKRTLWC